MRILNVIISYTKDFECYRLQDLKRKNGKLKYRADILVYIYSREYEAFWRAGGGNYVKNIDFAGVYTLAEAYSKTSHCSAETEIYFLVKGQEPQC